MTGYAELQCTSNFSFLRGASHPHELVEQAKALGHRAIAITDANTLAGIVRGHVAAEEQGLGFVVGCRLGLSGDAFPSPLEGEGRNVRAEARHFGWGVRPVPIPPTRSESPTSLKGRGEKQIESCEASVG